MVMHPLEAQTRAANPDISAWVVASAGSGKTKVLVDRLLNLLLQGAQPERIVCLTFTRAAAAEMNHRLNQRLRELALTTPMVAKVFLTVLDSPPKIQTIHSFCQNLLRKFAFECGVSPHFRILDKPEKQQLTNQAFHQAVKKIAGLTAYWSEARLEELVSAALNHARIQHLLAQPFEESFAKVLRLPEYWQAEDAESRLGQSLVGALVSEALIAWALTRTGEVRKAHYQNPKDLAQAEKIKQFWEARASLRLAQKTLLFLQVARQVQANYTAQKLQRQTFDFSDMVQFTLQLLQDQHLTGLVFAKLGAGIDHLLIDEAQDTTPQQWELIQLLIQELFPASTRTLFVVGDPKQSIYGFQGAHPEHFLNLSARFQQIVQTQGREWHEIDLQLSFRSTPQILYSVDNYFAENPQGIAFTDNALEHKAFRQDMQGGVVFWPVVALPEENAEKVAAYKIGGYIRTLIDQDIPAKDILVLVRRRSPFVNFLVSRLKGQAIPVAGLDKLLLTDHLAVQDLCTFGRFLLLPEDDFNLACLLKSSLVGITEAELQQLCQGRTATLWQALQQANSWQQLTFWLKQWLEAAGWLTPYQLYSYLLAQGGRAKILSRLGHEAEEVVDEFLALVLAWDNAHTPSLDGFLNHLSEHPPLLERELSTTERLRIMTIHGAKGLEAPVVVLIDSPAVPLKDPFLPLADASLPGFLLRPPLEEDCDFTRISKEQQKQKMRQEENRLLYVALTRARDHLYITGWESQRQKAAWYHSLQQALNVTTTCPPPPTQEIILHEGATPAPAANKLTPPIKPDYRKMTPPPPSRAQERGILIHRLLELLPTLPPESWEITAHKILGAAFEFQELFPKIQTILTNPEWAQFFAPSALAEVCLFNQASSQLIRFDRLVVEAQRLLILDYKTHTRPPPSNRQLPGAIKQQLALYSQHLRHLYPTHQQVFYLLWTETLSLMEVPEREFS